jgi:hypothetical protein
MHALAPSASWVDTHIDELDPAGIQPNEPNLHWQRNNTPPSLLPPTEHHPITPLAAQLRSYKASFPQQCNPHLPQRPTHTFISLAASTPPAHRTRSAAPTSPDQPSRAGQQLKAQSPIQPTTVVARTRGATCNVWADRAAGGDDGAGWNDGRLGLPTYLPVRR